jgi:hypothetical protein
MVGAALVRRLAQENVALLTVGRSEVTTSSDITLPSFDKPLAP